ncbi:condensation domain-containing protein [Nonomuraea basaltis]|uniref:condensation domain-containing protein n=1 Tax=Nonomuraea basaltis TaxID=2495887 RepID=UPI00148671AC|nr:condensation domain-containing protein [Nonomuraea basaltis]
MYEISFGGLTSEFGPLTWGQRHIRTIQVAHPENRQQFNLYQLWPIPPGNGDRDVLSALQRLVERHGALRTRLLDSPGGGLAQQVHGDGEFAVRVREIGTGECSEEDLYQVAQEVAGGDFAWDEEFLVRFGILTAGGAPAWLVMMASHMIVDGASGSILKREFMALLAEPSGLPEPPCQPVRWAAKEQSQQGAETSRRSAEYMRDVLQRHPGRLFGGRPSSSETNETLVSGGFPVVLGHGPGLGKQVEDLAVRWRTSEAAVAMAALTRSFAAQTGIDSFPLGVTCSNRHLPGSDGYVGMLAQNGVIGVDLSSDPPPESAAQMWRSLLTGYAHSAYDQDELGGVLAEAGVDDDYLGFGAVGHFVNFLRLDPDPVEQDESRGPSSSILIEDGDPADYRTPRFGVVIASVADDLAVRMFADPAVISLDLARSVTRSFLEGLQSL